MNPTGKEAIYKIKNAAIIAGIIALILLVSVTAVIIEQGSKYGF